MFPAERALRVERAQFLATVESLDVEALEHGTTLCAGWTPRDVVAHVVGLDDAATYLRGLLRINAVNETVVRRWRDRPLAELLDRARRWAAEPAVTSRLAAVALLGDVAVHHQDVLRPTGGTRDIPEASRRAILREGAVLGARRLASYRVVPTDVGRPLGRGRVVRGTAEALGMWLAGRDSVTPELRFGDPV